MKNMSEMVESEKEPEVEEKKEIEKVEDKPRKSIFTPEICSWTNDEGTGTIAEIYLPGVEKDTIKLKMDKENIFVAGETDNLRYVGAYGLCCSVDPEHAKSTYKNGLLRIEVPFLDITFNTIDVRID